MKQQGNLAITRVCNTSMQDFQKVLWLFDKAIKTQNKNGYKVWESIDEESLKHDINKNLQFKIERDKDILCIFSIQYGDPFIWRHLDKDDAIYLHRIVVNPIFKGQRLFEKVLTWVIQFAEKKNKKFIRMDTWADNFQLIEYYKSFGFNFIENYKTAETKELPIQNRNLNVALLEMTIN